MDQNATDSLLEKATIDARNKKSGSTAAEEIFASSDINEASTNERKVSKHDDVFEILADGSTALILKPGFRLKSLNSIIEV